MVQHKPTQKTDLYQQLLDRSPECVGNPAMGSLTLLTLPQLTDAARCIMLSSHLLQRVVLLDGESPIMFTNFENVVGDNSSYNRKAKHNYEVVRIVSKFNKINTEEALKVKPKLYFVYNKDNNMYDVIDRVNVEDLTEKYGFQYDTSGLDKFQEGDVIEKGTTLTRPTSYDEYGNYGYGKNIRFMYQIDNDTIEDAIVVSESLAKRMTSIEVETVTVPINDNDFLINLYGDVENYKAFPDIGENTVNKRLCVKRGINNAQILFDFKSTNTRTIFESDIKTYIDGEVVDIDIYCNKPIEDVPNTIFNQQLLRYMEMSNAYYEEIKEVTSELIDSGIPCSQHIKALHKRAVEITSGEFKFKDDTNSAFSNIVMNFTVKRKSGLTKGQKLTGGRNCPNSPNCGKNLLGLNY